MITNDILEGNRIILKQITINDCTEEYVQWLNDKEINQYLETKWEIQTLDSIKQFVISQRENNHSILFAIFEKETNRHIRNIKIGPIHPHYKYADISYFIGIRDIWGKGVATEAIGLVTEYAFDKMGLHKIEAGTYDVALGSQKALLKNGFHLEATLIDAVKYKGKYINCFRYYKISTDSK